MKSLVGERRAVAAAVLAFYGTVLALLVPGAPDGFELGIAALAGCYALGFIGVVAGYFWARWYAIGLGLFGVITSIVTMWQTGPVPLFLYFGASHALIAIAMWGEGMATIFDGRTEWRARFHLDEHATNRLGKAVIRIGISLPYVLLYALLPRQGQGAEDTLLALGVLGFATAGVWAVFRMRTWGIVALGAAAATLALGALHGGVAHAGVAMIDLRATATLGAGLLAMAVLPFARPVADFLRRG